MKKSLTMQLLLIRKQIAFYYITFCMLAFISIMMSSCEDLQHEDIWQNTSGCLDFNVTVDDYSTDKSRASYSIAKLSNTIAGINATFENGDAFGLFIVDKDGIIIRENLKCERISGKWTLKMPIEYFTSISSCKYFAYYPYKTNLVGSPLLNEHTSASSADEFFEDVISNWTIEADQSTREKFSASDLMISSGTASMPTYHDVKIAFTFSHKMGLVLTKERRYLPNEDGTYYLDGINDMFTNNKPYVLGDWLLYFVKPNTSTTLGTQVYTVGSGEYEVDASNNV